MTECRILYITNLPTPYKRPRLNALADIDGVEVTVYYSADSNYRHEFETLPEANFKIKYDPSRSISWKGYEVGIGLNSFHEILSFDADVYIVGGWNHFPAWISLLASKLKGTPIGVISANTEQGYYSKYILSKVLGVFDFYLALSSPARENLVNLGIEKEKITVLPNVIDVEQFQASITQSQQESLREKWELPDSGVVLYVGNLEFNKGVQHLIRAVSTVNASCHLLIIGDGPYRSKLESLAQKSNQNNVTFTGKLPNSVLPNYYALSDVFVLPTHGDTWGLVVNEALACGTPVISTTAAGVSGELLQHEENGFVIPPKDPESLADFIECLLANDKLRTQYEKAGKEKSSQYTPRSYAECLMNAITSTTSCSN